MGAADGELGRVCSLQAAAAEGVLPLLRQMRLSKHAGHCFPLTTIPVSSSDFPLVLWIGGGSV